MTSPESNGNAQSATVKGQWRGDPANINREGGPPKTHWWSELLKDEAEKLSENEKAKTDKLKKKEMMARALVEKAEAGDIAAIKEFGDRVQGKSPQGIGTLDPDGNFKEQSIGVVFVPNDPS